MTARLTSDKIMQVVSDVEYMADGPRRWASGALRSGEWAIVAKGEEQLNFEYEVFYEDRLVAHTTGIFDARDFVAIESAIARAAIRAGGKYDPLDKSFRPDAQSGTPEFDQAVTAFECNRTAINMNIGV